ncbi:MAG: hypothetical protein ABSH51_28210 [Solirubrobacteraceae bacterium]|jgi:hypothetical protein
MSVRLHLGRHVFGGAVLAATVAIASAGVAFAANVINGGSYSGHYRGRPTDLISFEVSPNGKSIIDLHVDTPFKCNGGCGGIPSPAGGSARISKKGTFTATLRLTGPGSTKVIGSDTVTGTFLKHGAAKGTVTSHFSSSSAGETVSWTATG